jgi:predicted acyltransferase
MTSERDLSLDAFRGLTVILMIIVNLQGNGDAAYAALKHAEWNGLTFADLVFPWFLFIVGLSTPLALDRLSSASPWPIVLRRALVLFALGVVLAWLIRPVEFDQIRWMGVLQRIGIVYLACAAVLLLSKSWRFAAWLAAAILMLHGIVLDLPPPDGNIAGVGPGEGFSGWLDRAILPGRLLRTTWDPEGVLSTFPAIASGLIGVAVMRWKQWRNGDTTNWLIGWGVVFVVLGIIGAQKTPINKALWTTSFVFVSTGFGLLTWMILGYFWARISEWKLSRLCVLYGQTALTFYVIHMLLLAVIVRKMPDGTRIWDALYAALASTGVPPALASLIFAIIAGALCTAPLAWLKRKGWLIKA